MKLSIAALWLCCVLAYMQSQAAADWPMAGANAERSSWGADEVPGNLSPQWYRPIEPYISQNVQVIATNDLVYVSTARGLYAFRAADGDAAWVYPTALPLGHSPAIHEGVAYVGGFDHKIHAIDARMGKRLWTFDEAEAGYRTSPLVAQGKVFMGNRDGWLYAVHAQGSPQAGKLAWKQQTGGPILFSAALKDGVVFIASSDMHAYAFDAETGAPKWKSGKLPGEGFHSWWPVVWGDYVVFAGTHPAYRLSARPGLQSIPGHAKQGDFTNEVESSDVFGGQTSGDLGARGTQPGIGAEGTTTMDMSRTLDYLQKYPHRRTVFVLDRRTGREYTFDHGGKPAYAPFLYVGTKNGNRYPPLAGPDGALYLNNKYIANQYIARGQITGWAPGLSYVSVPSGPKTNAVDEPMAASGGGQMIYWALCCDREGGSFRIAPPRGQAQFINYNLGRLIPGYDAMWAAVGDQDGTGNRLWGAYGSNNGIYHNHTGDQNPFIPYQGKLFIHRSNCLIAFAPRGEKKKLPLAKTEPAKDDDFKPAGEERLRQRLALEVEKMLAAGHLRPGYFNGGQWGNRPAWGDSLNDYFSAPGDTLWALIRALPRLPPEMQPRVRAYLQAEFKSFPPARIAHIGWRDGAGREAFDLPPEVQADLVNFPPSANPSGRAWRFPPMAFYALWKYAEVFGGAAEIFREVKSKLEKPPEDAYLIEFCYNHNAWIAGYIGYLNLEKLAGQPESAEARRELDRLLRLRADTFSKDTPWTTTNRGSHIKRMSVFRNFLYLTPELADYLRQHAREKVEASLAEIERVAPYWFVTRYEGCLQESTVQNLNDYNAVFQARAWILREPRERLERFLDVPAFAVGDLFYIHQLASLLDNAGEGKLKP